MQRAVNPHSLIPACKPRTMAFVHIRTAGTWVYDFAW